MHPLNVCQLSQICGPHFRTFGHPWSTTVHYSCCAHVLGKHTKNNKKNQSNRENSTQKDPTQPGNQKALPTQPLWCPRKDQGGLCVLLDRSFIMKQTQHWRPQVFWALSALLTAVNGPLPACCNIIYSPFHSCVSSAITFCKCTWATWCTHFWKDATLPPSTQRPVCM